MTIREAKQQLESENYTVEDLLTLYKYYIESSRDSWRSSEDIENARIRSLAIEQIILSRVPA